MKFSIHVGDDNNNNPTIKFQVIDCFFNLRELESKKTTEVSFEYNYTSFLPSPHVKWLTINLCDFCRSK